MKKIYFLFFFVTIFGFCFDFAKAQQLTQSFNTPGTYTWTVPTGVTSIQVELWGAGGSGIGYASNSVYAGNAGGGGGYARGIYTVVPNTIYNISVGGGTKGYQSVTTSCSASPGGWGGYTGGSSSFGNLIYATGGGGAKRSDGSPCTGFGDAGIGGLGFGQVNISGNPGYRGDGGNAGNGGIGGTYFRVAGFPGGGGPISLNNFGVDINSPNYNGASYVGASGKVLITYTFSSLPDLTISSPTQTTAIIGTPQTFTAIVSNTNVAGTGATFQNLFQTSTLPNGGGIVTDYPVTPNMAILIASGTAITSKSITFGAGTPSTMYVRACADKSGAPDVSGLIAESDENNNCSPSWTTVAVTTPLMVGTLIPASPFCSISLGVNSCNINFIWTTTNPVLTSVITSSYPTFNTIIVTGNNGGPTSFAIPYASSPRTFYLYNNSQELATSTVSSSCIGGTHWDISTTQCVANVVITPPSTPTNLTATPNSCGTGTISVSWNASNGATNYTLKDDSTIIYSGPSISFTHTGLSSDSSHSYTVRAENTAGNSAYTSIVSGIAPTTCAGVAGQCSIPPGGVCASSAQCYQCTSGVSGNPRRFPSLVTWTCTGTDLIPTNCSARVGPGYTEN